MSYATRPDTLLFASGGRDPFRVPAGVSPVLCGPEPAHYLLPPDVVSAPFPFPASGKSPRPHDGRFRTLRTP